MEPKLKRYTGEWQGTWLQGHIEASYHDLVGAFGEPHYTAADHGDDKTDAEWNLDTPSGLATVYNYKDGKAYNGAAGQPTEEITHWHIGGAVHDVVTHVHAALDAYLMGGVQL